MRECVTHHHACDCREAELEKLRAFSLDVMQAWPEGDVDGGELQNAALRHGLIRAKTPAPTQPCGDGCTCAEYYGDMSDGVTCYEKTELLTQNGQGERQP